MRNVTLLFLLILITSFLFGQQNDLVIRNINVVDVEKGNDKKGDIHIQNGVIKEISKKIKTKSTVQEVDGSGKWLIPGLMDAHVHLFQSGGLYTRPDVIDLTSFVSYDEEINWLKENTEDLLSRYLRCGITTIVDVGGPMRNYALRDQYNDDVNYPNIYLTGPLISTYQPAAFEIADPPIIRVESSQEAIALVQKQLPFKPDFIKIWYITLPTQTAESTYDIVEATIKESHKHDLKVAVHATELNTAKLAIRAGADILVHSVDDAIDQDFIRMCKEHNVVYIPTLGVHGNYVESFGEKPVLSKEDFMFANPTTLGSLFDSKHFPAGNEIDKIQPYMSYMESELKNQDSMRVENLKKLNQTNIPIATGTDAGNIGTLHASSYFDEVGNMKRAGMTATQILKASTINIAKAIGKEKELGSITEGKVADLLILNANPLSNIEAIKDIQFVIKGGYMLSPDSILAESPADLVQQQVNGYNAGDIDAFLHPYSEDVEIYDFPNELSTKGKANIHPQYKSMFISLPNLHCEITNRMVLGNTVIDHEKITGIPGIENLEAIAVYKIENNKIAKVYFIE